MMKPGTAALLISSVLLAPAAANAIDRSDYVDSVIGVLRTHASLIEELSQGDRFKYSDNLVRHAMALKQTFGLLGPMEWHVAKSARLHARSDSSESPLNEDHFDELAEASQKSLDTLVRAAHDSMEKHDAKGMKEAIEEMKSACNACHRQLPATAVPDVWGDLQRE
jgi:hypothetical protein